MDGILDKIKGEVLDLVFPKKCIGCGQLGEFVCLKCQQFLRPDSRKNYIDLKDSILDGLTVLSPNNKTVKQLVYSLKYNFVDELIDYLDSLMCSLDGFEEFILVPVPLHPYRYRRRGFNQAELICQSVGRVLGNKINNQLLLRKLNNKSQVGLSGKNRQKNVTGIFQYNDSELPAINSRVLLVDDVYTTGSTMGEAARALKENGVVEVQGLVIVKG